MMLTIRLGWAWFAVAIALAIVALYLGVPRLVGAWRDWGIIYRRVTQRDPWAPMIGYTGPRLRCGDCGEDLRGSFLRRKGPGRVSPALNICALCYNARKHSGRCAA